MATKPLAALETAKKNYKKFIEPYDGQKAFNYYRYTNYCISLSESTDNGGSGGGYLLRDMAMCSIDTQYNPSKSVKFLGMDMLD